MRKKRRVTGRFYIFLLILLVIAFVILRPILFGGPRVSQVMMANAPQEVRDAADFVTLSCDDSGVSAGIEKFQI